MTTIPFEPFDSACDELEPGVYLERRSLLSLGLGSAISLLLAPSVSGMPRGLVPGEDEPELDVEAFLDRAAPLAKELVQNKLQHEDAYLFELAAILTRLVTLKQPGREGAKEPGERRRVSMNGIGRRQIGEDRYPRLAVVQIRFDPGARIPYHDHRNYNGVILGLEGDVRCRNFDVASAKPAAPAKNEDAAKPTTERQRGESGPAPPAHSKPEKIAPRDDLILQETIDQRLSPGRFSTLSTTRDNVHDLTAGANGARVLDIFTYCKQGAGSRYLEVDEGSWQEQARTFAARWRVRRRRRR